MSQLYALLKNGQLRYIDLSQEIIQPTRELFVNAASELMNDTMTEVAFDGRYFINESDNEIYFITMALPDMFNDIPENQRGLTLLDIDDDDIQSVFWYDNGAFLFQMFSNSNLLENKYVFKYFQEQHNFTRMTEKAFVIYNKIQAIHKNGKLYFKSFPSASKIFNLSAYMVEATTAEVNDFGNKDNVSINVDWLTTHANTRTRRLIKQISETGTLDAFMNMNVLSRNRIVNSVNVDITIRDGKLVLPSSVSKVNKVLEFLNEDVYVGLITKTIFKTNSKKPRDGATD